jgi:hypothetical protein
MHQISLSWLIATAEVDDLAIKIQNRPRYVYIVNCNEFDASVDGDPQAAQIRINLGHHLGQLLKSLDLDPLDRALGQKHVGAHPFATLQGDLNDTMLLCCSLQV